MSEKFWCPICDKMIPASKFPKHRKMHILEFEKEKAQRKAKKNKRRKEKAKLSKKKRAKRRGNKKGYPDNWPERRKQVLKKESSSTCFLCGKTREQERQETGRDLHVHHINGKKRDCSNKNLMPLCSNCHRNRVHEYKPGVKGVKYPSQKQIEIIKHTDEMRAMTVSNNEQQQEMDYARIHGDPCAFLEEAVL